MIPSKGMFDALGMEGGSCCSGGGEGSALGHVKTEHVLPPRTPHKINWNQVFLMKNLEENEFSLYKFRRIFKDSYAMIHKKSIINCQ